MIPHIISLLLVASLPLYTLGDETGSWGTVSSGPSESECRPYIEKALQQGANVPKPPDIPHGTDDVGDAGQAEESIAPSEVSDSESSEIPSDVEGAVSAEQQIEEVVEDTAESAESQDKETSVEIESKEESSKEASVEPEQADTISSEDTNENTTIEESAEAPTEALSDKEDVSPDDSSKEASEKGSVAQAENVEEASSLEELNHEVVDSNEESQSPIENTTAENEASGETESSQEKSTEVPPGDGESAESMKTNSDEIIENIVAEQTKKEEIAEESAEEEQESAEDENSSSLKVADEPAKESLEEGDQIETHGESEEEEKISAAAEQSEKTISEEATDKNIESGESDQTEEAAEEQEEKAEGEQVQESSSETPLVESEKSAEETGSEEEQPDHLEKKEGIATVEENGTSLVEESESGEQAETIDVAEHVDESSKLPDDSQLANVTEQADDTSEPPAPEEELSMIIEVPEKLRGREHMEQILHLTAENEETERLLSKTIENTLRDLKKLYDVAIKPLEILYKYRDLSNRHFGDAEIFSKPLILFMGPWSGGKSTIINYLLENEYKKTALRSGAEPSPAYFNIVMWGEHEEILDGTQLAADWTFSGLQKFGQGLLDRLRGLKLNHPLLEKVNIVEIPGILEIRKQVERLFPFNDACQWFIDRADIIFLVYDPSKLDVGPETEAILDQLKGREMQTKIILNKADQVKPEELMRVQGTLIWNISPLMSSTEPPVMYSTSLWSIPYEVGSPTRLLFAQEKAFLKDLRDAVEKRVENKIASARRFAVRVRNHAKMVDCYLTTYYNHKSFFGNKKKISDDIIEHPQNYHIYEGLSTLTNISRYDLPDPDVYRDFFRLNPVYEFQQLSSTCTYFRGCPINRLDVAIAYDLPELVGKYKKQVEEVLSTIKK